KLRDAFLQRLQALAGAQQYDLLGLEFFPAYHVELGQRALQQRLDLFLEVGGGLTEITAHQACGLAANFIHQDLVQHLLLPVTGVLAPAGTVMMAVSLSPATEPVQLIWVRQLTLRAQRRRNIALIRCLLSSCLRRDSALLTHRL